MKYLVLVRAGTGPKVDATVRDLDRELPGTMKVWIVSSLDPDSQCVASKLYCFLNAYQLEPRSILGGAPKLSVDVDEVREFLRERGALADIIVLVFEEPCLSALAGKFNDCPLNYEPSGFVLDECEAFIVDMEQRQSWLLHDPVHA